MRLSIPKHHDQYLQVIASQMGTTTQEALNYLLWELRRSNYQFGSQHAIQTRFDPSTFESEKPIGFQPRSPQAIAQFEEVAEEIDPVIARLVSLGICDEF